MLSHQLRGPLAAPRTEPTRLAPRHRPTAATTAAAAAAAAATPTSSVIAAGPARAEAPTAATAALTDPRRTCVRTAAVAALAPAPVSLGGHRRGVGPPWAKPMRRIEGKLHLAGLKFAMGHATGHKEDAGKAQWTREKKRAVKVPTVYGSKYDTSQLRDTSQPSMLRPGWR